MAVWASEKKKQREQQATLQAAQKWGVFDKRRGAWVVSVVRRNIEGCVLSYAYDQEKAKEFDTEDQADSFACQVSLGTMDYIDKHVVAKQFSSSCKK